MDKAMEMIGNLAQALKVPAEAIWQALVVRQRILAWSNVAELALWLGVTAALALCGRRLIKRGDEPWDSIGIVAVGLAVALALCILCASSMSMRDTLTGFAAPEAGAVLELLSKIGK